MSRGIGSLAFAVYVALFFAYLFAPIVVMAITAFNTASYPTVTPFEGFTLAWFGTILADGEMMAGLAKSLWIGALVVAVSVPVGLAGAIVMTQVPARARPLYYLVVVSPVLTPGIVIGISTVIFWKDVTTMTGMRALFDGVLMTVVAQSSFISAYCMLIFLARLQRFDRGLEEAALDLGATNAQAFRHVLLPYLAPAALSSAVIAFLSSFENYNVTTFAILADKTLTTVLAGRVRQGTTPAISALAVMIIAVTVIGAIAYEIARRRKDARAAERRATALAEESRMLGAAAG